MDVAMCGVGGVNGANQKTMIRVDVSCRKG